MERIANLVVPFLGNCTRYIVRGRNLTDRIIDGNLLRCRVDFVRVVLSLHGLGVGIQLVPRTEVILIRDHDKSCKLCMGRVLCKRVRIPLLAEAVRIRKMRRVRVEFNLRTVGTLNHFHGKCSLCFQMIDEKFFRSRVFLFTEMHREQDENCDDCNCNRISDQLRFVIFQILLESFHLYSSFPAILFDTVFLYRLRRNT